MGIVVDSVAEMAQNIGQGQKGIAKYSRRSRKSGLENQWGKCLRHEWGSYWLVVRQEEETWKERKTRRLCLYASCVPLITAVKSPPESDAVL